MSKLFFILLLGLVLAARCHGKKPETNAGDDGIREKHKDSFQKLNDDNDGDEQEINVNVNVRIGEPGQGRPQWFGHRPQKKGSEGKDDHSNEEGDKDKEKPPRPTGRPEGNGSRFDEERPSRPPGQNGTRPDGERPGRDNERDDTKEGDCDKPTGERNKNPNGPAVDVNVNVHINGGSAGEKFLQSGLGNRRPSIGGLDQEKEKEKEKPKPGQKPSGNKNKSSSEQAD